MSQGFHVDIVEGDGPPSRGDSALARPWVGIRFECCGVYSRVYRNAEGSAYEGRCPKCLKRARLRVGSDGTSARFFLAE